MEPKYDPCCCFSCYCCCCWPEPCLAPKLYNPHCIYLQCTTTLPLLVVLCSSCITPAPSIHFHVPSVLLATVSVLKVPQEYMDYGSSSFLTPPSLIVCLMCAFLLNVYNLRDVLVHCKGGCALQIGRQMGYHPGCEGCSVQNEQCARCM